MRLLATKLRILCATVALRLEHVCGFLLTKAMPDPSVGAVESVEKVCTLSHPYHRRGCCCDGCFRVL